MPHVARYTDFLLVRLQSGNIALREITGCVAVGQQHPSVPIWAPGSDQAVAYERARFKVCDEASPSVFAIYHNGVSDWLRARGTSGYLVVGAVLSVWCACVFWLIPRAGVGDQDAAGARRQAGCEAGQGHPHCVPAGAAGAAGLWPHEHRAGPQRDPTPAEGRVSVAWHWLCFWVLWWV